MGFQSQDSTLDQEKVKELESGAAPEMKVKGTGSLEDFVSALETPRKIILMVPAGKTCRCSVGKYYSAFE